LNFSDILLIIVSSAGLLHGVLLAVYLCFIKKKRTVSTVFLGLILVFMGFRIGKSVMLNFGSNLEPLFIFAGLALLLIIGPLLRWYVLSMIKENFKTSKRYYLLELFPFGVIFLGSFFITKDWFDKNNNQAIILFGSVLIFIYLHFAFYIFGSWRLLKKGLSSFKNMLQTKSQKAIFDWLHLLLFGFIIIWISYFLNLIDNTVPYIIGPIVYSITIYFLSYKAFVLKVIDLDGSAFKDTDDQLIFNKISTLLNDEKLYLETDISLSMLSKLVGKSNQKVSEIINQYAQQNFNDFINFYRIRDAKTLLADKKNEHFTISSIAFDTGFSSLSSFNSAFKKFEGITPSGFKKKENVSN